MTWGEIKLSALKKMFAKDEIIKVADLDRLSSDDDTKVYLNGMVEAGNEAINRILPYYQNNFEYSKNEKKYVVVEKYKLTESTANDEELPFADEACVLIPLYIASQLYKDDDIAQATQYRNEFEIGLQELQRYIDNPTEVEIVF